jgi:hypothetical protein
MAINIALHEAAEKLAPTRQLRRLLIDEGSLPLVAQAVIDAAQGYLSSLEQRLADAEGAIAKKDEALKAIRHMLTISPYPHGSIVNARLLTDGCIQGALQTIDAALSLTPSSQQRDEEARYARVGRAVEKWFSTLDKEFLLDPNYPAVTRLEQVIARANAGEGSK